MFHDSNKDMLDYGLKIGSVSMALMDIEREEIKANNLNLVFEEAELPLIEVLASMEFEGVKVNSSFI